MTGPSRGSLAATSISSPSPHEQRLWLVGTLLLGGGLRLLAALISSPTPGDDVGRLIVAARWAEDPRWFGLSGAWAPLHTYVLGGLIRAFGHPFLWAVVLGWASTTIALPLFYLAVRDLSGSVRRAGFATLLLAIYYVHIWMAGTAYVEGPYTAFLFAALWGVARASRPGARSAGRDALLAGLAMAVALLLRHEAKVVWLVVVAWLAVRAGRGPTLRFAIPSGLAFAWQLLEPSLRGASFLADAEIVARWKAIEVTLRGSSLEGLRRWIVMPAGSPSAVVVLLGLIGLWSLRRELKRDLFGLLFLAQAAVFLALTIYPGWVPYLRYLFLYFVCLLPHAAWTLEQIAVRRARWAVALVLLAVLIQGGAWSTGRNPGRSWGWLPVYRAAPEQAVLDRWVAGHPGIRHAFVVAGYPQSWDIPLSLLRAGRSAEQERYRELSYDEIAALGRGGRLDLGGAEALIMDPTAPDAARALAAAPSPPAFDVRMPRLAIGRLPPPR